MPDHLKNFGPLLSIFIGLLMFIVSVVFINSNVVPADNTTNVYLADHSDYRKGDNGERDTIFVKSEVYFKYIDTLSKDSINSAREIVSTDTNLLGKFKKLGSRSAKMYLVENANGTFKVEAKKKVGSKEKADSTEKAVAYFFKKSKLLHDRIFFSSDSAKITNTVDNLDRHYFSTYSKIAKERVFLFNRNPTLLVWIVLISIAIGVSFCLIPLFFVKIKEYCRDLEWLEIIMVIALAVVSILLLFVPLIYSGAPPGSLLFKPNDMFAYFNLGITPKGLKYNSTMPFVGVFFWLVLTFLTSLRVSKLASEKSEASLKEITSMRAGFEKYLIVIAILLAYTVYCTGLQLEALNSMVDPVSSFKLFPGNFSKLNGLMQTFFLVLIYYIITTSFTTSINAVKQSIVAAGEVPQEVIDQYNKDEEKSSKFKSYLKLIVTLLSPALAGTFQPFVDLIFGS